LYGGAIAITLSLLYPEASFLKMYLYAVAGCFSHLLLDITNSYGAQILWPIYNKKITLDLLLVYDPMLIIVSLAIIIPSVKNKIHPIITLTILLIYFFIRYWMKLYVKKKVESYFKDQGNILLIRVMPSMVGFVKWHFVIKIKGKRIIGECNLLSRKIRIIEVMGDLDKKLFRAIRDTKVAKFFAEFTPLFHIKCDKTDRGYVYSFIDLRYYIAKDFLHHATAIMDENFKLITSVFHPYRKTRNVEI